MPAMKALCLAFGVQTVGALRKSNVKMAGDVPILNYRYRHLQEVGTADGAYDWILKVRGDVDVASFCSGCRTMGGVSLAAVRATEEELSVMLKGQSSKVEWVEPDTPVEIEEPQASDEVSPENTPWGHEAIGLSRAGFTGFGSHIYVMDTGIRVSHNDFGGRAIPTIQTTSTTVEECNGDTSCATDSNGHGTHCAGTAGGTFYGVAKQATLHAMRVCCTGTNILGGMDWLTQNRILPAVMTMSLGSYSVPESSRVAVDAVVAAGITVTVSAGNRGTPSCDKSYTFIRSAIGVAASDSTNTRASFSNYGECNAIFAPGVSVVSASHTSDTGTSSKSGTSMSAPHVAGVVAMLLHEEPSLLPEKIRERLVGSAQVGAVNSIREGDPNLLLNADFYSGPPTPPPPPPAPTPAPPTPAPGVWELTGSGCSMDGNCVQSNNHPSNYGNSETCEVKLWGSIPLTFEAFSTESRYDFLTAGGTQYDGTSGPPSGSYSGSISWATDSSVTNSGWRFCRTDSPSPSPVPTPPSPTPVTPAPTTAPPSPPAPSPPSGNCNSLCDRESDCTNYPNICSGCSFC